MYILTHLLNNIALQNHVIRNKKQFGRLLASYLNTVRRSPLGFRSLPQVIPFSSPHLYHSLASYLYTELPVKDAKRRKNRGDSLVKNRESQT